MTCANQCRALGQHSRGKFEAFIADTLCQIMFDLNRFASDIIMFSMPEFGFFDLPDELCTGSSIMPQKMNPDILELLRARYHTVVSNAMRIKTAMGNLISGYNRDIQETKRSVMESFDITLESLAVASLVAEKLGVNKDKCKNAMTPELFVTKEAYKLVSKGIPFREAYKAVADKYFREKRE